MRSGACQELQHMAVGIPEIDTSPPTAGVDLPVFRGPQPASIRDTNGLNAIEHRVELRITHMKGIVMTLEAVAIIEVEGQGIIHPHRHEVPHRSLIRQTKDVSKEPCRRFLVVCRDNGMVQCDSHTTPPEPDTLPWHHAACPCSTASHDSKHRPSAVAGQPRQLHPQPAL